MRCTNRIGKLTLPLIAGDGKETTTNNILESLIAQFSVSSLGKSFIEDIDPSSVYTSTAYTFSVTSGSVQRSNFCLVDPADGCVSLGFADIFH